MCLLPFIRYGTDEGCETKLGVLSLHSRTAVLIMSRSRTSSKLELDIPDSVTVITKTR